ncbi:hypothetical protein E4U14_006424 [Claviceps sp. LM454 group G7]|nr:hypothetical protein E4U14_006424 [Claviceps sp. LM454 group G7]
MRDHLPDEIEDEDGDDNEGDLQSHGQTVAERLAAYRKLKRFRLTHQQTRFLMSEFAKQPHPDAAHRERLSREIPGLSPRQVQVWFQNRRAKMKRLSADDRDRMIRMRAVPEDFDNVQALHSPYGAVHGVATTLPPSNLGPMSSPYGNQGAGSLMLDIRRATGESYLSPTGLTPSFGNIELGQSGPANVSDVASSATSLYQDRFAASGASPNCPVDVGYRNCGPYWHAGSGGGSINSSARSSKTGLREGQSIHDRNWSSASVPEALHMPVCIYQANHSGMTSSESQVGFPNNQYVPSVAAGFASMETRTYSDNASPMGRSSGSLMEEDSAQRTRHSPHALAPGPLMGDCGVEDRHRTTGLSSLHSPAQNRGHALPPLRTNISSYQANYSRGPGPPPLNMSLERMYPTTAERVPGYLTAQTGAPKSAPSEYSFNRPWAPPAPNPNASIGSQKHGFGHDLY